MPALAGVNVKLADVVVMAVAVRLVTGLQGGSASVVKETVAAGEVWPGAQLDTMLTVYVVAGVRPVSTTGEAVGLGVTVWAVPPWAVYVTV